MRVSTADRFERLLEEARQIEDKELREFVVSFLEEPVITFAKVSPLIKFEESPASPRSHHSYPGGLIDHTIGVARISRSLSDTFSDTYGFDVNRDYLVAAALLHDVFKYYQYDYDDVTGGFKQRDDWYLSHDYSVVAELSLRGASDYLVRIISEAHGMGVRPTPEGQLLSLADYVDAKLAGKLQDEVFRACIDIERELDGRALAVKIFHAIMRNYTVFDLVPYIREGSKELREFIKQELGLE